MSKALKMGSGLLNLIYPVGSIYISVNPTSPHDLFGGDWELFSPGRTLVCIDTSDSDFNTVKKIGGSKNMQQHKHYVYQNINGTKFAVVTGYDTTSGVAIAKLTNSSGTTTSASNTTYKQDTNKGIVTDDYAGTGNSGNLQPYVTCYFWERIA